MNRLLTSIYEYQPFRIKVSSHLSKYISINLFLFLFPLLFDLPQLIQGTIINLMLIYIALNYKKMELIPAVLLPSLATTLRGTLIGTITPYLVLIMPIIWLGNLMYIFSIRYLTMKEWKALLVLLSSGIIKSLILFISTFVIVRALNLPELLLISMGIFQVFTSLLAGSIYLIAFKKRI